MTHNLNKKSGNMIAIMVAILYLGLGIGLVTTGISIKGTPMNLPTTNLPDLFNYMTDNYDKNEFVCINAKDMNKSINAENPKQIVTNVDKSTSNVATLKTFSIVVGFILILFSLISCVQMFLHKHKK